MITRFAPSPTGHLHLGHAYAALYAYDLAAQHGGDFLLRYEDIDITRVRAEYYPAIEEDLAALGIKWSSEPLRQMDRLVQYGEALEKLQLRGVAYPCFCTRREIENAANAPHGSEGPIYPGTCRKLSERQRSARMHRDDTHCWRLDAEKAFSITGALSFTDQIHGSISVEPFLLGDVVLARKDIATSYHLAVVIDDAYQQITDVSRGDDLLSSTHVHRTLQHLLDLPEPRYHHHHLILDEQGKRLAKRCDSLSLKNMLKSGQTTHEIRQSLGLKTP
ncbi:MAG: tRNA glutamyl-Q(34) synthetase GluQRS [Akkermansiaceae bacterium]